MAIETITQTPTRLTIHPEPSRSKNASGAVDSGLSYTPSRAVRKPDVPEGAELSAWDVLDLVNPLQHIPFISAVYREVTNDAIRPEMKLVGSAVLGGIFGFVSSLADVVFEQEAGKDVGATVLAALGMGDESAQAQVLAQNTTPEMEQAAAPMVAAAATLPAPAFGLLGSNPYARLKQVADPSDKPQLGRLVAINPADHHILELYGNSNPQAAAKAYRQTNMMSYLASAR
jgi:hypothetical protein